MDANTLERANEVREDLRTIDRLHEAVKSKHWIAFATPSRKELYISNTLRKNLIDFLEVQKEEFKKEFQEL